MPCIAGMPPHPSAIAKPEPPARRSPPRLSIAHARAVESHRSTAARRATPSGLEAGRHASAGGPAPCLPQDLLELDRLDLAVAVAVERLR
jgi:hypothetical protein